MKIKTILFGCLCFSGFPLCAESVFGLSKEAELQTGVFGAGLVISSFLFFDEWTPREDTSEINMLDQPFLYPRNSTLDTLGTLAAGGLLVLPALTPLALGFDDCSVWGTYAVMYGEAFLLTTGIKEMLKHRVSRLRPYTYLSDRSVLDEEEYNESFPSGHTAYAFMGAAFLSTTFSREFPRSPWRGPLTAGAFTLAALTGILRVGAGEHFVSDVLAGAMLGALCGWGVPFLHGLGGEDSNLALSTTPVSLSFKLTF